MLVHAFGRASLQNYFVSPAVRRRQVVVDFSKLSIDVVCLEVYELVFNVSCREKCLNFVLDLYKDTAFRLVGILVSE